MFGGRGHSGIIGQQKSYHIMPIYNVLKCCLQILDLIFIPRARMLNCYVIMTSREISFTPSNGTGMTSREISFTPSNGTGITSREMNFTPSNGTGMNSKVINSIKWYRYDLQGDKLYSLKWYRYDLQGDKLPQMVQV